jgi:hypothetical protein
MVFNNISKLAGDISALSEPAKKLLELGLVAVNSHGHKVPYGVAAVALAGVIQTTMAISIGVSVERGVRSLYEISGTLAGIQKQLERMNILQSPELFADKVWKLLDHCIATEKDTNWYFIYHPDTHWTSSFRHLLRSRGTQTQRFIGIFHDLDTAVLFMQGIRVTDADQDPDERPEFRLLIPTFYHIVIQSPLSFPSNIEPFKIYGEKFDSDYLVYMNLPNVNESNLINIGSYRKTLWERCKSYSAKPVYISLTWSGTVFGDFGSPRVLGTDPTCDESTGEFEARRDDEFQFSTDSTADQDEISSNDEAAIGNESPPTPSSSEDEATGLHDDSGSDNRSHRSEVDAELSEFSIIGIAEVARKHKKRSLRQAGDNRDDDLETASITAVAVFPLQHDEDVDPSATANGRRSRRSGYRRKPTRKDREKNTQGNSISSAFSSLIGGKKRREPRKWRRDSKKSGSH